MRRSAIAVMVAAGLILAGAVPAQANVVTLSFDANDIFDYATVDNTLLNQLGTARRVETSAVTGRDYRTYNDGATGRDVGATPAQDLTSVANTLDWTAFAGYQGVSHVQLWLSGFGNAPSWGEQVAMKPYSTIAASVNGEFDWTADIGENPWDGSPAHNGVYEPGTDEYGLPHFNTVLGGEGHQNAISPDFNPADEIWQVTGDFYVDVNANGTYDVGVDTDLVPGKAYPIWFSASFNNWHVVDAYGNDASGSFNVQGTIMASTPVPEPASLGLLGLSLLGFTRRRRR